MRLNEINFKVLFRTLDITEKWKSIVSHITDNLDVNITPNYYNDVLAIRMYGLYHTYDRSPQFIVMTDILNSLLKAQQGGYLPQDIDEVRLDLVGPADTRDLIVRDKNDNYLVTIRDMNPTLNEDPLYFLQILPVQDLTDDERTAVANLAQTQDIGIQNNHDNIEVVGTLDDNQCYTE